jgi:hypothetical protein
MAKKSFRPTHYNSSLTNIFGHYLSAILHISTNFRAAYPVILKMNMNNTKKCSLEVLYHRLPAFGKTTILAILFSITIVSCNNSSSNTKKEAIPETHPIQHGPLASCGYADSVNAGLSKRRHLKRQPRLHCNGNRW